MTSVVAGGIFNALAFAGAGYLFHKLDKNGYEKEIKRHNLAMEKFQRDREIWYEQNVEKKNKINELRQKVIDADKDIEATNTALHNLKKAEEIQQQHEPQEPRLENYYEPSQEMKNYMRIVMGLFGGGVGGLIFKFIL